MHLYRVGVVSTRPSSRTARSLVRIHDAHNGSVSASNHQKETRADDKGTPADHKHPFEGSLSLARAPVIVEPHASIDLERHQRTEEGTDQ